MNRKSQESQAAFPCACCAPRLQKAAAALSSFTGDFDGRGFRVPLYREGWRKILRLEIPGV